MTACLTTPSTTQGDRRPVPAPSPLCTRGPHCGNGLGYCTVPLRCARGPRCAAPVRIGTEKHHLTVGAPSDRPLCLACERNVAATLDAVPQLYVDLEQAMPHRPTGARTGATTGGPPGSPMLTNGRAVHLQETAHELLTVWEDVVRDTAGLSMVSRRPLDEHARSTGRARAGGETQRAAHLLGHYLTAWLVHPPVDWITATGADPDDPRATPDPQPRYITQAGWQAAAALLDWHSRVRSALGLTKAVVKRDEPCMYCEVRAIVETAGEDVIRCENCGRSWPREEYRLKVRGFEPYLRKLAKETRA